MTTPADIGCKGLLKKAFVFVMLANPMPTTEAVKVIDIGFLSRK